MSEEFTNSDYWKAIILYGLNNATYKIALGKTLLELSQADQAEIPWHRLSEVFFNCYLGRLKGNPLPQQVNPKRLTVLERIVTRYAAGRLTKDQAIINVGLHGFNDVIPRFHTIGTNKTAIGDKFYHFEPNKALYLHDPVFEIAEASFAELNQELEARWGVLEGAFLTRQDNYELKNDVRDIYALKGTERKNLASNQAFLQGYQGNLCFYCGEAIPFDDSHVDHVLPRQVVNHDEEWNLVLAHSYCNLAKSDKLVGPHYIEKLIARNENIIGSSHPWKQRIIADLGSTSARRRVALSKHYDNVKLILGHDYWGGASGYRPETDPFYRKLITRLNNG